MCMSICPFTGPSKSFAGYVVMAFVACDTLLYFERVQKQHVCSLFSGTFLLFLSGYVNADRCCDGT